MIWDRKAKTSLKYDLQKKELVFDDEKQWNSDKTTKRGIIYARVSTEEQRQKGSGIEAQIIDCQRWAKNEGVDILAIYKDEAVSWTNLLRKNFQEAMSFLERENKKSLKIDYFICASTSRFSRSSKVRDTMDMVYRVEATGARLVAVWNGGIQETETEEWFMSFHLSTMMDALESMRGKKRVRAGQRWKLLSWYWPFPEVPVGYERIIEKFWWKQIKILIKKEPEASILKEWLELFADWILLTKQQLHNFFNERGLRSNSKKNQSWKLHPSIIDRILDIWKLYVYAWYFTYPDWDIKELVPAKHASIIDLETVDKIIKRLYKETDITKYAKRWYDQDVEEYPLKRLLLCPSCEKWVTKRKSLSKTGDYHHYYWCNNPECELFKKALPREKVHEAIRQRLKEITPPKQNIEEFEKVFIQEREQTEKDLKIINQEKKQEIKKIEEEMIKIERMLDRITNNVLFEKKQQRRADLSQQKEDLEYEINNENFIKSEFEKTYNEAKIIIKNPLALRDLEDVEIKQLLIRVCFGGKIYYKKNQGLHTPEISVLYTSFGSFEPSKTPNLEMIGNFSNILTKPFWA